MSAKVPLTAVAALEEVPVGEGRAFAVDGRQVAVFRLRGGGVRAVDAVCPHRQGPLADGLLDRGVVVCPLHGHTYDLNTGEEVAGAGLRVCVHHAEVADDGTVYVRLTG